MDLEILTTKKTWEEPFILGNEKVWRTLLNFWQWSNSDLLNNAMRWKLAEYIVATILGVDTSYRIEWDEYDLIYENLKIEIKSSAYIQSWEQEKFSKIIFGIRPTQDEQRREYKRRADVYIFCILAEKNPKIINPLDLNQWEFYVLDTQSINEKLWEQKTLSLNSLKRLEPQNCSSKNLKNTLDWYIK